MRAGESQSLAEKLHPLLRNTLQRGEFAGSSALLPHFYLCSYSHLLSSSRIRGKEQQGQLPGAQSRSQSRVKSGG